MNSTTKAEYKYFHNVQRNEFLKKKCRFTEEKITNY